MNYYEHHLGDYMRDTAHLSMLEDCAYRRLLDAYYTREKPLPVDVRECCKLARAVSKAERDAVAYVLREFFTTEDDGHHQARADAEIARFRAKSEKARASIKTRWDRIKSETESKQVGDTNVVRTKHERSSDDIHRAPVPSPQTPDTIESAIALSARGREEDPLPTPSPYTAVCVVLRSRGVARVNPSHPMLRSLVDAGATPDEFAAYAEKAAGKSDPFAYILGAVKGERERAASTATVHRGPMPVEPKTVGGESVDAYQARMAAERKAERERLAQQAGPPAEVKAKIAELRGLRAAG